MKLISMTDFVLEQDEAEFNETKNTWDEFCLLRLDYITNYANFLKQPLELWMFVPCNDKGQTIGPVKTKGKPILKSELSEFGEETRIAFEQYQKAKERVLFEGLKISKRKSNKVYWFLQPYDDFYYNPDSGYFATPAGEETIEGLIHSYWVDLELTPTAIKQIGL